MLPVTVVILTYNEEGSLPKCIASIRNVSDDIHILDSGSTDQTIAVAKSMGVSIHTNSFSGFGDQRNWAIDNIPHRYDWVLHLDADEEVTPEFVQELKGVVTTDLSEAGFFVPSLTLMQGRPLRYSQGLVFQVRLFHKNRLRFQNAGHGQKHVTDGAIGRMTTPYLHHAFSKGIQHWLQKHAAYAVLEADSATHSKISIFAAVVNVLSSDPIKRRQSLKSLSRRLPFRGHLRFFHILILRRGFMDGRAGLLYSNMLGIYESMIATASQYRELEPKLESHPNLVCAVRSEQ